MKKYLLKLEHNYSGRVIVDAENESEAEKKGHEIIKNTQPCWFETGSEKAMSEEIITVEKLLDLEEDIGKNINGELYAYKY